MEFKKFSRLYLVLLILHLVILIKEPTSGLVFITKPALLISLIGFYLQKGFKSLEYFQRLFAIGLIFCLAGDVLLMWDQFFILGLGAFLLGQLSYAFSFFRSNYEKKGWVIKYPIIVLPVLLFSIGLIYILYSDLGDFAIPVIIYTFIISFMVIMAINRNNNVSRDSFQMVLLGAILFVISDSVLAIDKFKTPYSWAPAAIMLTYGLAQYFLVWGMKPAEEND